MLGQPIGTLWSNIRARPTARSPPCGPDASVFLPPGAGSGAVREGGGTLETRAGRLHPPQHFQTCERLPTQDLAACWPPEAAGHSRRREKGNPRRGKCSDTSLSQKIMKNYHQSYSTCAHVVYKTHDFIALQVFNNIHTASLPQNVYYRVIALREGGHTPETRAASLDMPPHHPACMRSRCDAPVALLPLPPGPPSRLTL